MVYLINKMNHNKNKKAAIELSIGTIVVVVLAMTMLVLGVVLVRSIFTGSIDLADVTNSQVRQQITELFSSEGSNLIIQLGSGKTAIVREGGDVANINIGVTPGSGGEINSLGDLKFQIGLSQLTEDCLESALTVEGIESWFQYEFDEPNEFDKLESNNLFATIKVDVPDGTPSCTQKFKLTVENGESEIIPAPYIDSFFIEVRQSGIFS